jgi:hypothetical protein
VSRSDDDVEATGTEATGAEPTGAEAAGAGTGPGAKSRKVLITTVAAVVVLVVAGVVVYLLTSGDDTDDQATQPRDVPTITGSAAPPTTGATTPGASVAPPATATGVTGVTGAPEEAQDAQAVAEEVATAISGADVGTLNELSCEPGSAGTEDSFPADAKAEVVGEPKITGDTATVDLKLTIGQNEPATVPMPLTKKDGRWCIP